MTILAEAFMEQQEHSLGPTSKGTQVCKVVDAGGEAQVQTAFRRWTLDGVCVNEGPVPGLRKALTDSGLSSYTIAVEVWCCENGAAFLDELVDHFDSLFATLGPPRSEGPDSQLHARLRSVLSDAYSEDKAIDSEFMFNIATGSQARDEQGLVPGLQEVFIDAGLDSYIASAESWCCETGAAFLVELIDEFDDLCATLDPKGLAPHLWPHLRSVLVTHSERVVRF